MSKILKRLGKIISGTLLILFVWMITPLDGLTVLSYSPHPAAIKRLNGGHWTAFVFFTGVQSSGEAHSAPLRALWAQHADVVVVEYNRHRFDGRQTAYDTYQRLRAWGYQRVILDGASLGGLLATSVIDFEQAAGSRTKLAVMMQDVPMDETDLYQNGAKQIAQVWRPGFATNLLATSAFWSVNFNPPPRDQLGSGVDDQQLRAHYQASRTYPLSGWMGEVRYIVTRPSYMRNQYVGIPLVYMQSEHDSVVKPNADRWKQVFGGGTVIKVPQSTHIGFVEYPDRWRAAFKDAFRSLPAGW